MDINNSDRFRCLVAITQGDSTFEAGTIYFLNTRFDTGVSIHKGRGGVGNFTLSECNEHFTQVVKVKCIKDYKEGETTLFREGVTFDVADSGNGEHILYAGSKTEPTTITQSILKIYFKEVT